jgi:hypothetical protein
MFLQIEDREIEPSITLVALKGKLALAVENQRIENLMEAVARGDQVGLDLVHHAHRDGCTA